MSQAATSPTASTPAPATAATQVPAPTTATTQAPAPTTAPQAGPVQGAGVQALNQLIAGPGPLDPNAVVALIRRYPNDRDAMLIRLHSTVGNGFVQQVTAGLGGNQAAPVALDGVVQDGGMLGASVTVGAATASAHVTLDHPAEAAMTSVSADWRPVFSISARVPLAQIQASGISPDQVAQITKVSLMAGPAAAVSYHIDGDALVLGLAGAASPNQLNTTLFKLYLRMD